MEMLEGPGLLPLELDLSAVSRPDAGAEPAGYLVAADGATRIHFLDWGGNEAAGCPRILLVHGLLGTAWAWTSVARRLRGVARMVAMDLRGHGLSDAPADGYDEARLVEDVLAVGEGSGLLPTAGDDPGVSAEPGMPASPTVPFVLVGHGYGAIVAAWAARALGRRCAGLVLVDGGWERLADATGQEPREWLAAIEEPPEVVGSMAAWLADRRAFDPPSWDIDAERAARAQVVETAAGRVKLAVHPQALADSVAAMWTFDPAVVLTAVEAPIVVLAARDDDEGLRLDRLREVAALRAAAGRAPIHGGWWPELGHGLPRTVPTIVAAAALAAATASA